MDLKSITWNGHAKTKRTIMKLVLWVIGLFLLGVIHIPQNFMGSYYAKALGVFLILSGLWIHKQFV